MKILGLTGYKKSGKDEVCKILKTYLLPKYVVRVGFADALKEEVGLMCNVTLQYLEEHKDNFRLILQGVGTDFRRKLYSEDYWIEKWLRKLNHLPKDTHLVICPDVRFANEANMIYKLGGTIWRVVRNDTYSDGHESEEQINNIRMSFVIENTWHLDALKDTTINTWRRQYGVSTTQQ